MSDSAPDPAPASSAASDRGAQLAVFRAESKEGMSKNWGGISADRQWEVLQRVKAIGEKYAQRREAEKAQEAAAAEAAPAEPERPTRLMRRSQVIEVGTSKGVPSGPIDLATATPVAQRETANTAPAGPAAANSAAVQRQREASAESPLAQRAVQENDSASEATSPHHESAQAQMTQPPAAVQLSQHPATATYSQPTGQAEESNAVQRQTTTAVSQPYRQAEGGEAVQRQPGVPSASSSSNRPVPNNETLGQPLMQRQESGSNFALSQRQTQSNAESAAGQLPTNQAGVSPVQRQADTGHLSQNDGLPGSAIQRQAESGGAAGPALASAHAIHTNGTNQAATAPVNDISSSATPGTSHPAARQAAVSSASANHTVARHQAEVAGAGGLEASSSTVATLNRSAPPHEGTGQAVPAGNQLPVQRAALAPETAETQLPTPGASAATSLPAPTNPVQRQNAMASGQPPVGAAAGIIGRHALQNEPPGSPEVPPPGVLKSAVARSADPAALVEGVPPGGPTGSSIQFVPPTRPRPAAAQRQPIQRAPEPAAQTASTDIPTEFGPLPADLWRHVGVEPPQSEQVSSSPSQPVAQRAPLEEALFGDADLPADPELGAMMPPADFAAPATPDLSTGTGMMTGPAVAGTGRITITENEDSLQAPAPVILEPGEGQAALEMFAEQPELESLAPAQSGGSDAGIPIFASAAEAEKVAANPVPVTLSDQATGASFTVFTDADRLDDLGSGAEPENSDGVLAVYADEDQAAEMFANPVELFCQLPGEKGRFRVFADADLIDDLRLAADALEEGSLLQAFA
ncbi:MAG: hypothetical protein KDE34_19670, partial [Anaerolineales bacterium]|nr:hypothetical protein [Anaerolineales bacterium]